jgi:RHS repeat-associated protein
VPGYNFGYEFDAIGNRTKATVNTNESILTPNSLNQITGRAVPGVVEARGAVTSAATLTSVAAKLWPDGDWTAATPMNGQFYAALPVENSAGPRAGTLRVEATSASAGNEYKETEERKYELPKSPETIEHDADGNTVKDGLREYVWDTENRLVEIIARRDVWGGNALPAGAKFARIKNLYDFMERRVQKDVYLPGAGGVGEWLAKRTMFTWDGWNMVMEVEQHFGNGQTSRLVTRTYHYGPDLSGSEQGAGGVGGLQSVVLRDDDWSTGTYVGTYMTLLPCYDGNGNIMSYVDAATGEVEQEEEYGPFGENLRPRPTSVKRVPVGWSTKYTDEETGLVAYQLRYYNAELGRWLSRDPIEESGGVNLYGFVGNDSVISYDALGLEWKKLIVSCSPLINSG